MEIRNPLQNIGLTLLPYSSICILFDLVMQSSIIGPYRQDVVTIRRNFLASTDWNASMNARALYDNNLELIKKIIRVTSARQKAMSEQDREDFTAYAHIKLLDNDCKILSGYQGRGPIKFFLVTTINRLMHDYRNHIWGRWHNSEAAKKAGSMVELFEDLTVRDGYSLDQALEAMRTNHDLDVTRPELEEVSAKLPKRKTRGPGPDVDVETLTVEPANSDKSDNEEAWKLLAGKTETILARVIGDLDLMDRMILKMACRDNLPLSKVARALKLEQRPLYRRVPKILDRVRTAMEQQGINAETAEKVIGQRFGSIQALPDDGEPPLRGVS